MSQPTSRATFKEYCLRQLGAPVLEINVADEQVDDIIDDAVQYFNERHFDGVAQLFMKYEVPRRILTGEPHIKRPLQLIQQG